MRSKPMLVRQKGSKFKFLIATSSVEQYGYKGRRTPAGARSVEPDLGTRRLARWEARIQI